MKAKLLPIAILAVLTCLGLGIAMEKHGKPKKGKENFWGTALAWIVQWVLILWAIL